MKSKILKTSAGFVVTAVSLSIGSSIFSDSAETILRVTGVNTTLIIGSIGLFFVGLIYPRDL